MKYTQELCPVIRKVQLNKTTFSFKVASKEAVKSMKPGQFANILVEGKTLRRPISVCGFSREEGFIRFVFEVRGEGTAIMSEMAEGQNMDILAPLGNGFDIDPNEKAVFVGGGIGVPPLLGASAPYGANATALLGFRNTGCRFGSFPLRIKGSGFGLSSFLLRSVFSSRFNSFLCLLPCASSLFQSFHE